jgi:AcrR family transcriptional regulator
MGNPSMTVASATPEAPTRQRIIDAALRLFAQQGYVRTTVGQIESAAGLTPRAGGLYKHFPSKLAVLQTALQQRTEQVDAVIAGLDDMPLGDIRAELRVLATIALRELDRERDLLRIVMKEGDQVPELRREFYDRFPRRGYGAALRWLERALDAHGVRVADPEALSAVIFGGIVHLHLMETVFGEPPPDVDRERFLDAWVEATHALLAALPGSDLAREQEEATA